MATLKLDSAERADFKYRIGTDFIQNIVVLDGVGSNYDFTGHSATAKIYKSSGGSALVTFESGSGLTLSSGAIDLNLAYNDAELATLKANDKYYFDLQVTDASGVVASWVVGYVQTTNRVIDDVSGTSLTLSVSTSSDTLSLTVTNAGAGGVSSLTELSDVTSASTTGGFALIANGSKYVGRAITEDDISDLGVYLGEAGGSFTLAAGLTVLGGGAYDLNFGTVGSPILNLSFVVADGLILDDDQGQKISFSSGSQMLLQARNLFIQDFNGKEILNYNEATDLTTISDEVLFNDAIGYTPQTATGDGSTTIDWKGGNIFNFQFGAFNETFTFTAPTSPGTFILKLVQDSVGSRTATWPASVKWPSGTAPTLTTTATTGTDIVTFYFDGTSYFATSTLNLS